MSASSAAGDTCGASDEPAPHPRRAARSCQRSNTLRPPRSGGAATVYTDPNGRFKAVFAVDGGATLFTVGRDDVTDGTTNVDYATLHAQNIEGKKLQDYKEVDRYYLKRFTSDKCPVLDSTVTDVDGKTQRVFFTNGTDAWVLTFRTLAANFSKYLDEVNAMLDPFTI